MEIETYLHAMVKHDASDLFFSAGAPVGIKIEGRTRQLGEHRLTPQETRQLGYSILTDKQIAAFENEMEMNLSVALESLGRFSVARCRWWFATSRARFPRSRTCSCRRSSRN
jgi:twitching motility protein PilU